MATHATLGVQTDDDRRQIAVDGSRRDQRLSDLLRHQGLALNTRCGERGVCEGCCVELLDGALVEIETGKRIDASPQSPPVVVRGCMHRLPNDGGATIHLPPRSLLAHRPQVLTDFAINLTWAHDPLFAGPLAAAIDVGTTTVVVMLIDLRDATILSRAAAFNRQMQHGDDVLSRINLCMVDPPRLAAMQQAVVRETIAPLLAQCLDQAGRTADELTGITVAGNTTMLHLLAGVDPTPMGVAPFTPAFTEHRIVSAATLGLDLPRDCPLHLLPGAAAYIGADITCGIVASGLVYEQGPCLLIDIGTNGEIVLRHDGHTTACATAAGPAFEGAGLSCGVRAGDGAISHLDFATDPLAIATQVIGGATPIGLCGSAYIDLLAHGRRVGLVDHRGRFRFDDGDPAFRSHQTRHDQFNALRIATGQGKRPIVVTERDIAVLLQAKAAIAAGVLTLLERTGMTPADVRTVHLAGGFGMHVSIPSAIAAGLLPGFTPQQVELVGNTALAGAYLAAVDRSVLTLISDVARSIETIELNQDPGFESRYIDQLSLP